MKGKSTFSSASRYLLAYLVGWRVGMSVKTIDGGGDLSSVLTPPYSLIEEVCYHTGDQG